MNTSSLPLLNACLNGASAFFLLGGLWMIRRRNVKAHKLCMLGACATSVFFLASYLTYHGLHGSTRFGGQGWIRTVYFSILFSHTLLATVIVPLVLMTLTRALRGDFSKHARLARVTLPLWLYVSVTGVVIYWMLYRM